MRTPLLYRAARALARVAVTVYFRRLEISGRRRVPGTGPIVLAANHPHSITDALILGLAAGRMIHYVGHSGLFRHGLQAAVLRSCGVIPIYRPRDVQTAGDKNVDAFRACRETLERGGAIGIFPEGTSQEDRRVQRIRTGTARICLESEAGNDFGLGITIVPVGLNFQSRRHFRSRVLVSFGQPVVVSDYRGQYAADPVGAVKELTALLERRIRRKVVDIERSELENLVREVESVYKAELHERPDLPLKGSSHFKRDQALSREIARAVDYYYENQPELIWRVEDALAQYRRKRERLGLPDQILREEGSSFAGEAGRLAVLGALGLPIAAYGLLFNYLPYMFTGLLARQLQPDRTKIHGFQIAIGAVLYLLYYPGMLYLAARFYGGWPAFFFGSSLVPTGLFARFYVANMMRRRRHLRFAYLRATHGLLIQKLAQSRREIVLEMDAALEAYMRVREGSGAVEPVAADPLSADPLSADPVEEPPA